MSDILLELAVMSKRWRAVALAAIPTEYLDRGLQHKYLKLDNYASGLDDCADDLEELLATYVTGQKEGA